LEAKDVCKKGANFSIQQEWQYQEDGESVCSFSRQNGGDGFQQEGNDLIPQ
jgi:hypothetical protein